MGSSSGTSSGSYSGKSSEGGCNVDERKLKRMISNRESARRSRMRKRKHANDLAEQVGQLVIKNRHIVERLSLAGRLYLDMETENSVLWAQVAELGNRLASLNGIINCVKYMNVFCERTQQGYGDMCDGVYVDVNNQPMMEHVGPSM